MKISAFFVLVLCTLAAWGQALHYDLQWAARVTPKRPEGKLSKVIYQEPDTFMHRGNQWSVKAERRPEWDKWMRYPDPLYKTTPGSFDSTTAETLSKMFHEIKGEYGLATAAQSGTDDLYLVWEISSAVGNEARMPLGASPVYHTPKEWNQMGNNEPIPTPVQPVKPENSLGITRHLVVAKVAPDGNLLWIKKVEKSYSTWDTNTDELSFTWLLNDAGMFILFNTEGFEKKEKVCCGTQADMVLLAAADGAMQTVTLFAEKEKGRDAVLLVPQRCYAVDEHRMVLTRRFKNGDVQYGVLEVGKQ